MRSSVDCVAMNVSNKFDCRILRIRCTGRHTRSCGTLFSADPLGDGPGSAGGGAVSCDGHPDAGDAAGGTQGLPGAYTPRRHQHQRGCQCHRYATSLLPSVLSIYSPVCCILVLSPIYRITIKAKFICDIYKVVL